jgi:BirA family transcriptional regulator, biotin operon repressor / biotin---[acetyl-CoA-carboxylase] ligase
MSLPPSLANPPSFFGSAETIWQAVMALGLPSLAGFSVEVLPEVDSTNTELMRRARAGQTEPTLLVAQRQTAGRGRLGKHWHSGDPAATSEPGSNAVTTALVGAAPPSLTFSLGLLLSPQAWDGLSLAVGTSVASSLHPDIQLKWPNDLWVQGCKLAGILIETAAVGTPSGAQRYAVVGVGINIAPRPADGLSTPPASLQQLLPRASAAQALERVAAPLLRDLLQFEREGFAPFAARFAARDALRDREVALSDGMLGTAQGVDSHGALLVHTSAGPQRVTSAEVSVRPVAA